MGMRGNVRKCLGVRKLGVCMANTWQLSVDTGNRSNGSHEDGLHQKAENALKLL